MKVVTTEEMRRIEDKRIQVLGAIMMISGPLRPLVDWGCCRTYIENGTQLLAVKEPPMTPRRLKRKGFLIL